MLERTNGETAIMMNGEASVHSFLIEQLSDELEAAEDYCKQAKHAKHLSDPQLSNLFLQLSKEELKHYESLMEMVDKIIPNIKANPLYPLLEGLEEWAESIGAKLNTYR